MFGLGSLNPSVGYANEVCIPTLYTQHSESLP
jgi:hypothetical protein